MSEFNPKSLVILGRQPALGLAELESLYTADHIQPVAGAALLDIGLEEIDFKRLGGAVKLAKVLNILPTTQWRELQTYLNQTLPEHLRQVEPGKFTLGLSLYNFKLSASDINRSLLRLKKLIKTDGRPMRIVPNKNLSLSSAQVLHNKLTTRGGWELILLRDGQRTILAQSFFIQDIEAYASRDQARPKRDAKVGMLPPKLAQMIVNLAVGQIESPKTILVLDPFCGTGVILQEALLMGCSVLGSDNNPRMVEYAKTNLRWLINQRSNIEGHVSIETIDATSGKWPGFSAIASEINLGKPLSEIPSKPELDKIASEVDKVLEKFLLNLASQKASKDRRLCLAVPAWKVASRQFKHLPILDKLTDMGYAYLDLKHVSRQDLLYFREDQIVARQLIRLKRV